MTKYNESDFMPKAAAEQDIHHPETSEDTLLREEETLEETVLRTEETYAEDNSEEKRTLPDPEIGATRGRMPSYAWAKLVSAMFSPNLVPSYAIILAMWITPLSAVSENTRLAISVVVLLVTAMIPVSYKLTVARFTHQSARRSTLITGCVLALCQIFCAYYLYNIHAPRWLYTILVGGACVAAVYCVVQRFTRVSGHTAGMGALLAVLFFLGRNGLLDISPTAWIIAMIVIAGLVGSAVAALKYADMGNIALGYAMGAVVCYGVMCITIFPEMKPY